VTAHNIVYLIFYTYFGPGYSSAIASRSHSSRGDLPLEIPMR
jgi:hypothetical protein